MHPALKMVLERLSCVREEAELLFERDDAFRELSEEYRVCCEAASRLEGAEEKNKGLQREYAALRLRLEGELLRYLSEQPHS
jgi:hypothetical protein